MISGIIGPRFCGAQSFFLEIPAFEVNPDVNQMKQLFKILPLKTVRIYGIIIRMSSLQNSIIQAESFVVSQKKALVFTPGLF